MYISNQGPATDMPRGITYIGEASSDNLIDFEQQQALSGWFRRMRKIRPSKWKPATFVKAAAIVGGAVLLGPAAAALAFKGAKAGSGLVNRGVSSGIKSVTTGLKSANKVPSPSLQYALSRFAGPIPPFPPSGNVPTVWDKDADYASDLVDRTGETPPPSSSSNMLIPLLAVGALLMLSKNRK